MTNLVNALEDIIEKRRSIRIYDKEVPFDSNAVTRSLERAVLSPNSSNLQLWQFYQIKSQEAKEHIASFCLGQPAAKTANELVVFVARKDLYKERSQWNLDKVEQSFKKEGIAMDTTISTKDAGKVLNEISGDKMARLKAVQQYYGKLIPQLYANDVFGIYGRLKKLYVFFQGARKPAYRQVTKHDIDVMVHKSVALAAQTFMLSMTAEGYDTCPMEGFDSVRIKKYLKLPHAAEINMVISCGTRTQEGVYGKRLRVPNNQVIFTV